MRTLNLTPYNRFAPSSISFSRKNTHLNKPNNSPKTRNHKLTKKELNRIDFSSPGGFILGKSKNVHVSQEYQTKKLVYQEKYCADPQARKKITKKINKKQKSK